MTAVHVRTTIRNGPPYVVAGFGGERDEGAEMGGLDLHVQYGPDL